MADFLVTIDSTGLFSLPQAQRADIVAKEREGGRSLIAAGTLKAIWRLVGEKGSVGIWSAEDADALDAILRDLPIFPHVRLQVRPLATHPLMSAP